MHEATETSMRKAENAAYQKDALRDDANNIADAEALLKEVARIYRVKVKNPSHCLGYGLPVPGCTPTQDTDASYHITLVDYADTCHRKASEPPSVTQVLLSSHTGVATLGGGAVDSCCGSIFKSFRRARTKKSDEVNRGMNIGQTMQRCANATGYSHSSCEGSNQIPMLRV
eukprot:4052868-Amphidinium_carterae.1